MDNTITAKQAILNTYLSYLVSLYLPIPPGSTILPPISSYNFGRKEARLLFSMRLCRQLLRARSIILKGMGRLTFAGAPPLMVYPIQ